MTATGRFLFEMEHLKRTSRTGWFYAGVPSTDVESVAEHSYAAAVIAFVLAIMEGADPFRCAVLALFHDTQETRITDIAHLGRRYLTAVDNVTVTEEQTAQLPAAVRDSIRAVVGEYEARESVEAMLARDADKLECAVQAWDYRARGQGDVQGWIDSSTPQLRSAAARQLAADMAGMSAHDWWRAVLERFEGR